MGVRESRKQREVLKKGVSRVWKSTCIKGRLRNKVILSFADGRSASAMHFHKRVETGICSNVFLLKVVILDLATKLLAHRRKNQTPNHRGHLS